MTDRKAKTTAKAVTCFPHQPGSIRKRTSLSAGFVEGFFGGGEDGFDFTVAVRG